MVNFLPDWNKIYYQEEIFQKRLILFVEDKGANMAVQKETNLPPWVALENAKNPVLNFYPWEIPSHIISKKTHLSSSSSLKDLFLEA